MSSSWWVIIVVVLFCLFLIGLGVVTGKDKRIWKIKIEENIVCKGKGCKESFFLTNLKIGHGLTTPRRFRAIGFGAMNMMNGVLLPGFEYNWVNCPNCGEVNYFTRRILTRSIFIRIYLCLVHRPTNKEIKVLCQFNIHDHRIAKEW